MLSLREFVYALAGIWRLCRFDAKGLAYFDASQRGFWRSFNAAVLLLPAWIYLILDDKGGFGATPVAYLAAQGIGYAVGWLAYALLALRLADVLGASDRYFGYMSAYNWFQLMQAVVWIPAALVARAGLLPASGVVLLWFFCYGVLMVYNFFIARRALAIRPGSAMLLVVIDFLLGLVIGAVADRLAGLGA